MGILRQSRLPQGAWDTHVHVFDSALRSFAPDVAYTPAQAPLSKLVAFNRSLTQDSLPTNLVLVQPSPYGTDNSVLIKALESLSAYPHIHARGIAVVYLRTITDEELWALHRAGVRGLRLNKMASNDAHDPQLLIKEITRAAGRIEMLPDWKPQLFVSGKAWEVIYQHILHLPVLVIADHVGGMMGFSKLGSDASHATQQPGYLSLVDLVKRRKVIVKISGLYRLSSEATTRHHDLEPAIRELAKRVPDSLIYASDWPHTGDGSARTARKPGQIEEFREVDNHTILASLRDRVGDEATWIKMMATTPAQLFYT
ncbi:transcriptional family amidohydrolase family protein [Colletotrichum plurivorum]|uniref:Transcriptional family amidohydrolase family protein n=1 Tax=Colletotrichum plurivorum TaxID=2175906 RepID=A0A8H6KG21_9PEZI|nr:transcriptional family amidohydrolase family protein [Colletotrichum plurivorum]